MRRLPAFAGMRTSFPCTVLVRHEIVHHTVQICLPCSFSWATDVAFRDNVSRWQLSVNAAIDVQKHVRIVGHGLPSQPLGRAPHHLRHGGPAGAHQHRERARCHVPRGGRDGAADGPRQHQRADRGLHASPVRLWTLRRPWCVGVITTWRSLPNMHMSHAAVVAELPALLSLTAVVCKCCCSQPLLSGTQLVLLHARVLSSCSKGRTVRLQRR